MAPLFVGNGDENQWIFWSFSGNSTTLTSHWNWGGTPVEPRFLSGLFRCSAGRLPVTWRIWGGSILFRAWWKNPMEVLGDILGSESL